MTVFLISRGWLFDSVSLKRVQTQDNKGKPFQNEWMVGMRVNQIYKILCTAFENHMLPIYSSNKAFMSASKQNVGAVSLCSEECEEQGFAPVEENSLVARL